MTFLSPRPCAVLAGALALALAWQGAVALDLQGHRGARGLMPENTLPGFARALAIGVDTLEMDLGVTRDGVVLVSHDCRLGASITRDASGRWVEAPGPIINRHSRAELAAYDVGSLAPGSRYAKRFPEQRQMDGVRLPTLDEVLALAGQAGNDEVRFNVEIKIHPGHLDETASYEDFADAVVTTLRRAGMAGRTTVQSFDWRALEHVRRRDPAIALVYLSASQKWLDNLERGRPGASPWTAGIDVDDHGGSAPRAIAAAGGNVWSPYFRELDASALAQAHGLGLEVVVWTVNEVADMERMIDLGVDGIITDYPDRLRGVMQGRALAVPAPTPVLGY